SGAVDCRGLCITSAQGDAVFFELLRCFGARVLPLADGFRVEAAPLQGGVIDLADCPDLGPAAMVLGCFAAGETRLLHAGRLRYKESDRIAAMEQELTKFGFCVRSSENEIVISGRHTPLAQQTLCISSHNDHRIAMSLAVCGAALGVPLTVTDASVVAKSYPAFFDDLRCAGIAVEVVE
ncbi:MAG: 3-phosphoshikimate 1-carboxyvinyltransferase, partial [Pygmaiobacter sp.]